MKIYPLRLFVQRILLMRVGIATLGLALLSAGITYFVQRERLEQQVVAVGRHGISVLAQRVMDIIEQQQLQPLAALHQALKTGTEAAAGYQAGRFVWVQFYERSGTVVAEALAPETPAVEAKNLAADRSFTFPEPGQAPAETQRIGRRLFIYAVIPIADRQGDIKGYARGVFAVSRATAADMRAAALRSVLLVIGIVFGVTAILYPVILRLAQRLADYSTSLLDANLETLAVRGSAIAKRDADTDAHNYRVSLYAVRLAEKIGLGAEEMRGLIKGSIIHDVGKIGIPDAVLLKPGRLDEGEYRIMRTHVELGVDIVSRASWLRDSVAVVAGHHEKFGGGGYPKDIRAQEIPLAARIFAIADVFDALTSVRPYKKPLGFAETMQILEQGRGSHFDPALLDAFAAIARELYEKYAGHEGDSLRQELVTIVDKYFSAGMESLLYGRDVSLPGRPSLLG
jgi:HD-GYP domain-containing protein (c-di-GMP phosphodiesterase class II)